MDNLDRWANRVYSDSAGSLREHNHQIIAYALVAIAYALVTGLKAIADAIRCKA